MEDKNKTFLKVFTVIVVILGLLVGGYLLFFQENENTDDNNNETPQEELRVVTVEEEGFVLNAQFLGESEWEYTLNGTLPTPCHEYTVTPLVMESYPEQVVIEIAVISDPDVMCTQVIQEIEEDGEFTASQEAEISLSINSISKSREGN
jgi:hypothetical protein